jgi:pimeloyl-ACP methyl ester carboxylesterase
VLSAERDDDILVGRFDIGGRALFVECWGQGPLTVIVERGSGGASTNDPSWFPIRDALVSRARFCLYDRANLGQSDPDPRPRTAEHVVADLHVLLAAARIPPPYVLVGHSLGGVLARLYVDRHREQVVGLVLNDSMHSEGLDAELAILGLPQPGEPAGVRQRRELLYAVAVEAADIPEPILQMPSIAQVRAARPLGDLPFVVLTGGQHEWPPDCPAELRVRLEQGYQALNHELMELSTRSRRVIASQSGHFPQIDQPQLVIEAIMWVIDEIKPPSVISG